MDPFAGPERVRKIPVLIGLSMMFVLGPKNVYKVG